MPEVFAETLVFALLRPKTHLVVGSDSIVAITNRLGGLTDHLQEVITRLEEAGKDMAAAQAALNEMKAAISSAASTRKPGSRKRDRTRSCGLAGARAVNACSGPLRSGRRQRPCCEAHMSCALRSWL